MKKLFFLILAITLTHTAYGQDWSLRFSGGIISNEAADRMVIDSNDPNAFFEYYDGEPSVEYRIGIAVGRMGFDYVYDKTKVSKNDGAEEGNITFTTELVMFSLYLYDIDTPGFNASFGLGFGTTHIRANVYYNGLPEIENGVMFAFEKQFELAAHYRITENVGVSLTYTPQTMRTATGNDFTNTLTSLSAFYLF